MRGDLLVIRPRRGVAVCQLSRVDAILVEDIRAGRALVLRRVDYHGEDLPWGEIHGPLNPLPGQAGYLVEMLISEHARDPRLPRLAGDGQYPDGTWRSDAAWSPGRRWPLGTDLYVLRDAVGAS